MRIRARRKGVVIAQAGNAARAQRHRLVDLGRTGQRHHALLLAGRRVVDRCGAAALAGDELAADEMLDLGRHGATSGEGFVQASFRPTFSAVSTLMVA